MSRFPSRGFFDYLLHSMRHLAGALAGRSYFEVAASRVTSMGSPGDSYDLTMAAAALRANSADVPLLLSALCDQLATTLGPRLRVERGSGRRRRSDAITSVQITMGPDVFEARVDGASLHCTVGHLSGGIRIRTDALDTDGWLLKLLQSLEAEASHSDSARLALENIVIGGTP